MLWVGKIIHVNDPGVGWCCAGIITRVNMVPLTLELTLFTPNGSTTDAAKRIAVTEDTQWHDIENCPNVQNMRT